MIHLCRRQKKSKSCLNNILLRYNKQYRALVDIKCFFFFIKIPFKPASCNWNNSVYSFFSGNYCAHYFVVLAFSDLPIMKEIKFKSRNCFTLRTFALEDKSMVLYRHCYCIVLILSKGGVYLLLFLNSILFKITWVIRFVFTVNIPFNFFCKTIYFLILQPLDFFSVHDLFYAPVRTTIWNIFCPPMCYQELK